MLRQPNTQEADRLCPGAEDRAGAETQRLAGTDRAAGRRLDGAAGQRLAGDGRVRGVPETRRLAGRDVPIPVAGAQRDPLAGIVIGG